MDVSISQLYILHKRVETFLTRSHTCNNYQQRCDLCADASWCSTEFRRIRNRLQTADCVNIRLPKEASTIQYMLEPRFLPEHLERCLLLLELMLCNLGYFFEKNRLMSYRASLFKQNFEKHVLEGWGLEELIESCAKTNHKLCASLFADTMVCNKTIFSITSTADRQKEIVKHQFKLGNCLNSKNVKMFFGEKK